MLAEYLTYTYVYIYYRYLLIISTVVYVEKFRSFKFVLDRILVIVPPIAVCLFYVYTLHTCTRTRTHTRTPRSHLFV